MQRLQRVLQDVRLGYPGGVHGGTGDKVEVLAQREVIQDPFGELLRLGGAQHQRFPRRLQLGEQRRNAVIHPVLPDAPVPVIFPIGLHRRKAARAVEPVILHKGLVEGRADEFVELAPVGHLNAELAQSIGHRIGDALSGIGQGAVQIEQDHIIHCSFLLGC